MDRAAIVAQFDRLLPLAANWVRKQETRMLRIGVPLSEAETNAARAIGVAEPERVRLLQLDCVPFPTDPMLKAAAVAIQFLTPATRGLTCVTEFSCAAIAGVTARLSRTNSCTSCNTSGSVAFFLSCASTFPNASRSAIPKRRWNRKRSISQEPCCNFLRGHPERSEGPREL